MGTTNSCNGKLSAGTNLKVESIINLTQHTATAEQVAAGVVEPDNKEGLREWLTFTELPTAEEIRYRADSIADFCGSCKTAMIGGAPYLMGALEAALRKIGVKPVYAFSIRESVEKVMPDGTVQKTAVFRHAGFVEV